MNFARPSKRPGARVRRSGFTLVELALVMLVTMMVAGVSLIMLSQQTGFFQMMGRQAFLLEQAPQANNLLSRMLRQVDGYQIHSNFASAAAGNSPTLVGAEGRALILRFRSPNNDFRFAMLAFEPDASGTNRLGFYNLVGNTWPSTPDWIVADGIADVAFFVDQGVLRIRLDGPNGEQIIYSGHFQS